jgi:hypothetical protein
VFSVVQTPTGMLQIALHPRRRARGFCPSSSVYRLGQLETTCSIRQYIRLDDAVHFDGYAIKDLG